MLVEKLLQSIYENGQYFTLGNLNYQKMMNTDKLSYIAPQLYTLLKERSILKRIPSDFQDFLQAAYHQTVYKNIFIKHQSEELFRTFENNSIGVIPLKGVYFSERYFGQIGARSTSDIDILVNPSAIHSAVECVKQLGFVQEEEFLPGHFHCCFSKELPGSPIPLCVEIHWDVLRADTSNVDITEFWEEATPISGYEFVYELSTFHTFYLMCLHAWRHNMDSIKCFVDLMQILYVGNDQIDFSRLKNVSKRHQTWTRVVRTLSILYREYPFMRRVKCFPYERSIRYSLFAKEKGLLKYLNFMDYHLLSYDSLQHRLIGFYTGVHDLYSTNQKHLSN